MFNWVLNARVYSQFNKTLQDLDEIWQITIKVKVKRLTTVFTFATEMLKNWLKHVCRLCS